MPTRLLIAYLLIVVLAGGAAVAIWSNVHHSRRRTEARQRARMRVAATARTDAAEPNEVDD